jgi:hypothetical protein
MADHEAEILDREIAAFESKKAELERVYMGKFVVIHGGELIGAWDTLDAAAQEAVRRFGRGPYLIRQVGAPPISIPASLFAWPVRPPNAAA